MSCPTDRPPLHPGFVQFCMKLGRRQNFLEASVSPSKYTTKHTIKVPLLLYGPVSRELSRCDSVAGHSKGPAFPQRGPPLPLPRLMSVPSDVVREAHGFDRPNCGDTGSLNGLVAGNRAGVRFVRRCAGAVSAWTQRPDGRLLCPLVLGSFHPPVSLLRMNAHITVRI